MAGKKTKLVLFIARSALILGLSAWGIWYSVKPPKNLGGSGNSPYEGKAVQTADDPKVYFVHNGKRYHIANPEAWVTIMGSNDIAGNSTLLSTAELNTIPDANKDIYSRSDLP